MELRPIQKQAIESTIKSFRGGGTYHLVHAPVAFGKTIFSASLISKAWHEFGARSLFLAHLTELVTQTADKVNFVDSSLSCGVLCGTLNEKESSDVTIGTRQTVAKNLDMIGKINLLICDECHLWGEQYQSIVDHFLALNPRLRVVGLTGTPYSLKEGWIYGEGKIWGDPVFSTSIDKMIDMKYLSPYRYKVAEDMSEALSGVKMVAGEFHEGQLTDVMVEEQHMGSVAKIIEDHCKDRKSVLVFAVSIDHAEKLAGFLGVSCVHSKLGRQEWRQRVDRFKSGEDRILVNVSQLSIGFDAPCIDAVILARPTMSPALFVQMVGRGLRVMDGKDDCLVVDMVGNYVRHGLPSDPKIRKPKEQVDEKERKLKAVSVCHECFSVVDGPETTCPNCKTELTRKKEVMEKNEEMRLREIEIERKRPRVIRWWEKEDHVTRTGAVGSLFCLKVSSQEKPLYRFAGYGTNKIGKVASQLESLKPGQPVEIVRTAFGEWIA